MNTTSPPAFARSRFAIIAAAAFGFTAGAAGIATAQNGADDVVTAPVATIDDSPTTDEASGVTVHLTIPEPTTTDDDSPTTTDDDSPTTTDDDSPTTTDDESPTTTDDDSPTTTDDDSPTTTIDDSPTTTIDDSPITTDDDSPSTTVAALPDPFTQTYSSTGGSITVTWTGTTLVLDGINAAAGSSPEIEAQAWDRIRVDFEGESDARIEVRINDGRLRVRID